MDREKFVEKSKHVASEAKYTIGHSVVRMLQIIVPPKYDPGANLRESVRPRISDTGMSDIPSRHSDYFPIASQLPINDDKRPDVIPLFDEYGVYYEHNPNASTDSDE